MSYKANGMERRVVSYDVCGKLHRPRGTIYCTLEINHPGQWHYARSASKQYRWTEDSSRSWRKVQDKQQQLVLFNETKPQQTVWKWVKIDD